MDPLEQLLREDGDAATQALVSLLQWAIQHPQSVPNEYHDGLLQARSPEDSLWMALIIGVLVKHYDPGQMPPWPQWQGLWGWIARNGGWDTGLLWTSVLNASASRES